MMGGMVTVVSHTALSTVAVTVVLGALVDTITGTDVVISVQTGLRSITSMANMAGVLTCLTVS